MVLGAMTGTSADGVDVAAVRVRGRGLRVRGELVDMASASLRDLAQRVRSAQRQVAMSAGDFARLSRDLALAHCTPMLELAARHGTPDLVVVHGQTLFHEPPVSLQLIDPFPMAQALGCPVLCGLRGADLAAGGEGAPITPLSDWMMFRSRTTARAIVNLGGFVNATLLPPNPGTDEAWIAAVRGCDICLCNQWLDHIARTRAGIDFDDGGRLATTGRADQALADSLSTRLNQQRASGRSLGTAHEWAKELADALAALSPEDALATAVCVIARTVSAALDETWPRQDRPSRTQLLLAGGGARNSALTTAIAKASRMRTTTTESFGIGVECREAFAMALLGAAAADGADTTLPSVTGREGLQCGSGLLVVPRLTFTKASPHRARQSRTDGEKSRTLGA